MWASVDKRWRCDKRWRRMLDMQLAAQVHGRWWRYMQMGGGNVTRGNTTTSQRTKTTSQGRQEQEAKASGVKRPAVQ